jgi:glutamate carboxypeptidase
MNDYDVSLQWIESQYQTMMELAVFWAGINSHTFNQSGLAIMADELTKAFSALCDSAKQIEIGSYSFLDESGEVCEYPLGKALIFQKYPQAAKQALLVCHCDTVYPVDHSFQKIKIIDDNTINGPGITDAKGGIVIMLKALHALEASPSAEKMGWTVIINPDEEIGSPSSSPLLKEYAQQNQLGLVFEPCLHNGRLIGSRKGSANFTILAKGKAAHAGRNIDEGKNAINALALCIPRISALHTQREGLTVNAGTIKGGTARNVVAEKAIMEFNIRFQNEEDYTFVQQQIKSITAKVSKQTGVNVLCEGALSAVPKPLTDKTLKLLKHIQSCGNGIGLGLQWEDSGGVCDGNRLQSAGLPTVDTLGAQGGNIHSSEEYLLVDSLVQRTKLTALTLLKWANEEWDI